MVLRSCAECIVQMHLLCISVAVGYGTLNKQGPRQRRPVLRPPGCGGTRRAVETTPGCLLKTLSVLNRFSKDCALSMYWRSSFSGKQRMTYCRSAGARC